MIAEWRVGFISAYILHTYIPMHVKTAHAYMQEDILAQYMLVYEGVCAEVSHLTQETSDYGCACMLTYTNKDKETHKMARSHTKLLVEVGRLCMVPGVG